jgi:hypothetical protein
MPLSEAEKSFFLMHKDKPLVGLIHKETKNIVLAACIPPKVFLNFDSEGQAVSGFFMENKNKIDIDDLQRFNDLIKNAHVPRLACISEFSEKSAHEFLFEQKCQYTKKSEWGGFAVSVNSSGVLEHQFVSGAFNSTQGKRKRGALLSEDLISEVIQQFSDLMPSTSHVSVSEEIALAEEFTPDKTPPRKHQCLTSLPQCGFFSKKPADSDSKMRKALFL